MSELLSGPPLRIGDVRPDPYERLGVELVNERGLIAARVYASDDALPTLTANALLFMGAARTHRALTALLKASRDPALGIEAGSTVELTAARAEAENRLDRAEREAAAALAAATPGMVPPGHQDVEEPGA